MTIRFKIVSVSAFILEKFRITYLFILFFNPLIVNAQKTDLWNGKIYTTYIPGGNDSKFTGARYSMFIPAGVKEIKAILIHQHGCTMEGTGILSVTDVQYQAFAKKWSLALLFPDLYPHAKNCTEWYVPENGSEVALFTGLEVLSRLSRHPEINSAPWLLWGHSGGGHWSLAMLRKHYERIIAVVSYSAAFDSVFNYPPSVSKVPVLLRHAGAGDINQSWAKCWLTAVHNFSRLRDMDGFVSIIHNNNQTHNLSFIRNITFPFFDAVLAQRLPLKTTNKIRDMDASKVWFADTVSDGTAKIYRASGFKGNIKAMSVLPDSVTALKFLEFLNTGNIHDVTPPSPPFNIRLKRTNAGETEITWQADADIESGISCFNIYKNGQLSYRYPPETPFQDFNTNGDNPIPPVPPEMRYQIPGILSRSDLIEITTVNREGFESEKSKK